MLQRPSVDANHFSVYLAARLPIKKGAAFNNFFLSPGSSLCKSIGSSHCVCTIVSNTSVASPRDRREPEAPPEPPSLLQSSSCQRRRMAALMVITLGFKTGVSTMSGEAADNYKMAITTRRCRLRGCRLIDEAAYKPSRTQS